MAIQRRNPVSFEATPSDRWASLLGPNLAASDLGKFEVLPNPFQKLVHPIQLKTTVDEVAPEQEVKPSARPVRLQELQRIVHVLGLISIWPPNTACTTPSVN